MWCTVMNSLRECMSARLPLVTMRSQELWTVTGNVILFIRTSQVTQNCIALWQCVPIPGWLRPGWATMSVIMSRKCHLLESRATVNRAQNVGYYNPIKGLAYIPYIPSGSVQYPTTVDLLIFSPNGPTSVGPTAGWPCLRFHAQIASYAYEYIEHYRDMPSWAVTSNNQNAVGQSAGVFSTPAKFNDFGNRYYFVYGELTGSHTWGHLLKTSLPYRWEPFQVGSDVPYNAFLGAYTTENEPLFIVMKDTFGHVIGTYNPKTNKAQMEHWGIGNPTSVHILTLFQPTGSSAWSDAGYDTYSGPITALRTQHGTTVTGIQCRFGAQWSAGFWPKNSLTTATEVDFKSKEYIKGVKVGLSDTLEHLKLFTNFDTYRRHSLEKQEETQIFPCLPDLAKYTISRVIFAGTRMSRWIKRSRLRYMVTVVHRVYKGSGHQVISWKTKSPVWSFSS